MAKLILLIEDHPDTLKLLEKRFKVSGFKIITAKDGEKGLEMALENMPDLIVTDLALPKMTGNIVVRRLRQSDKHKHIPIIVLSAFVHAGDGEGVEVPADCYMPKPFFGEQLMRKIHNLLGDG